MKTALMCGLRPPAETTQEDNQSIRHVSDLLKNKRGLVFGVANERSIGWHVARNLIAHGADCGFAYLPGDKMQRRVHQTLEQGGLVDPWTFPCDVAKDDDIEAVFRAAADHFGPLDYVIHSVAFANRDYLQMGNFTETPREVWAQALDISAYTLVAMSRAAQGVMPKGGSIIAMSYYGSEKVVPGYNVMGVAKAALEASTRYLAAELGARNIRVNTISAGPVRTLSAMAVGGIDNMLDWVAKKSPLGRNIEVDEVGKSAVFLVSDLSSAVTGENLHVDAGYNTIGI